MLLGAPLVSRRIKLEKERKSRENNAENMRHCLRGIPIEILFSRMLVRRRERIRKHFNWCLMRHDLAQEQKHPEEVQKRSNIRPKQIGRLYSL